MPCNLIRSAAVAALLGSFSPPAFAHITLENASAPVGSTYKAILRVPHGSSGAATTAIRVHIPEGFFAVKPIPKAGWTLETSSGPYSASYDNHGVQATEGLKEISWSHGDLRDAFYDEFVFVGTFARTLRPGRFFFPVLQQCGDVEETWIDTTGDESAGEPAPSIDLLPARATAGH